MAIKLKSLKNIKSKVISPPKLGEIVEGEIVAIGRSKVFVDLGAQGIGIIYGREFHKSQQVLKDKEIGEKIKAKVVNLENEDGYRELSMADAVKEIVWNELKGLQKKNETIEVKVEKANKGGLVTTLKGISAFLPVSQLAPEHYPEVEGGDVSKIAQALQEFIGEKLEVKILDINPSKKKLILSEKAARETEKIQEIDFEQGDEIKGEITGMTDFGAFVEINENLEALLPDSEIKDKDLEEEDKIEATIDKITDNRIYLNLNKII